MRLRAPLATTTVAAVVLLLAAGCAVGPDYQTPDTPLPVSWKLEEPWRPATPADAADKGPWWKRFNDATLDTLQAQALAGSPTLAIAQARLAQARATLAASSASQYPQLGLGTRASRLKISANRPLTNYSVANSTTVQNDFAVSLNASYELDLAGRVQRSVEGASASAEQSAADLATTRLLLGADVANNYFNLRSTDIELDVLSRSIGLQRRALELVTARHDLGAVSGLDVAQQQALLETTRTQVDVLKKQRAQYEHALATLTGTPAPSFALPVDLREIRPPAVPLGVPSDILQRRPDVASAERAMAAANAQIGVATAAFYPSFLISPTVGVDSRLIESLFNGPSLLWSVGVSATQVLFDGGRIRANVDFAKAGYDATVGSYRRTVLTAMQEVEDGITGLSALDSATTQAQSAVTAARRVLDMATSRYEGGASTYLDVITAQQSLLTVERQAAQLQGQRLLTSVFLVKALGGDWCEAGRADSASDVAAGCRFQGMAGLAKSP
ncbi:NodT family efflux transporter outer membrane factor (OMF) lipoprotein [Variovorax sp. 54]|uniref:efflux transporter outer membrane subunit n=1 Tax=Variovorax sp. 54 TaxID=2035212 RepID=UPI000C1A64DE|nr:efflux transporter outer membrane subunit [Variovorax sp. 54]PIF77840.1 NodT family efflux transporter outer membrane factor (OMF) lipoprotein [Variovorax sp. 54]